EHERDVCELGDPKARMPRHSPRVLAERAGAVFLQCLPELVGGPLGNDGPLERHHRKADDRDVDPAGVPRPDVRRHVRTGGEQPDDRDRECAADLARDSPPRDRIRERLRAAELEDTYEENRGRPDSDEEREQVQVQNHVVRVQRNDPPEVGDAATQLYGRSGASSSAAPDDNSILLWTHVSVATVTEELGPFTRREVAMGDAAGFGCPSGGIDAPQDARA